MANEKRRDDEGGSGAETKGRIPDEEPREAQSPARGVGIDTDRRREQIANNPDAEEELAEEALEASGAGMDEALEGDEDEAAHDHRRRD
jgi:hypothetical protein